MPRYVVRPCDEQGSASKSADPLRHINMDAVHRRGALFRELRPADDVRAAAGMEFRRLPDGDQKRSAIAAFVRGAGGTPEPRGRERTWDIMRRDCRCRNAECEHDQCIANYSTRRQAREEAARLNADEAAGASRSAVA